MRHEVEKFFEPPTRFRIFSAMKKVNPLYAPCLCTTSPVITTLHSHTTQEQSEIGDDKHFL